MEYQIPLEYCFPMENWLNFFEDFYEKLKFHRICGKQVGQNECKQRCIFITVLEMTSTLDFLTTGPNADRWLRAHDDPLASIYTFSK